MPPQEACRRRRKQSEHQGPLRCEPRRPFPPPQSFACPPGHLHTERRHLAVAALQITIARHGPKWEEPSVSVIAQIEHARKAGRCIALLIPYSICALSLRKICYAASNRRMLDLAGRHQTKQGPCRLRCGARCRLVTVIVELVAGTVLAPAAVLVLNRDQPVNGCADLC